ncbi:MBL fold metallo-hydrolase [Thermus sp. NMX2.A1]|uniref:MBL fold metallo-hydrolase n=1 Tax=Thermus sp. NMX2.A1 TaxID=570924 RepID=UPI000A032E55
MKCFPFGSLDVLVWGGWGEIGGNQILLFTPQGGLPLDFGKPFGRFGPHFTEFLGPRDRLGLRDLLFLGLLPPVPGLYRKGSRNTLFPSPLEEDFLHRRAQEGGVGVDGEGILALLLSHAHLDHSGALGYLRQDLPVVTSAATAAIAEAMQGMSKGGGRRDRLPEPPHPEGGCGDPRGQGRGLPAGGGYPAGQSREDLHREPGQGKPPRPPFPAPWGPHRRGLRPPQPRTPPLRPGGGRGPGAPPGGHSQGCLPPVGPVRGGSPLGPRPLPGPQGGQGRAGEPEEGRVERGGALK